MNAHAVRLALPLTLLLGGPALACSVKAGYMVNGMIRLPAGVTSTCGLVYKQFREGAGKDVKWAEMFYVTPAAYDRVNRAVETAFRQRHFVLASTEPVNSPPVTGKALGYANLDSGAVIALVRGKIGDQPFLAFLATK